MKRKPFDPLKLIPSAAVIREKLSDTETLAARLRIMLDLAEKLESPTTTKGLDQVGDTVRGHCEGARP